MPAANSIFISYAHEDEKPVLDLYKRLQNTGFDPWLDVFDLVPGEKWDYAIRRAIKESAFIIVCLSSRSVAKRGFLQREFRMALDLCEEKLDEDIFLIPVRLDECAAPDNMAHYQWVDLFSPGGWERVVHALEEGMRRMQSGSPEPARQGSFVQSIPVTGGSDYHDEAEPEEGIQPETPAGDSSHGAVAPGGLVPQLPSGITKSGGLWAFITGGGKTQPWIVIGVGVLLIAVSNVLIVIPRTNGLLDVVFQYYAYAGLRFFYGVNFWISILCLVTGYTFLFICAMNVIYRDRPNRASLASVLTAVGVLILAAINGALSFTGDVRVIEYAEAHIRMELPGWSDGLLSLQNRSAGGFRTGSAADEGVQVWTTAQIMTSILAAENAELIGGLEGDTIWKALEYIERVRLTGSDGGWGYWDGDDRQIPVTEVSGWVIVMQAAVLQHDSDSLLTDGQDEALRRRLNRDVMAIINLQESEGGWAPIPGTNDREARTYSTIMALWGLIEASDFIDTSESDAVIESANAAIHWLTNHYDPDHGWVPKPGRRVEVEYYPGLTAQVLFILADAATKREFSFLRSDVDFIDARSRFLDEFNIPDGPLNSMDARVSDSDQHIPNSGFTLEGSTFLWYPWAIAVADNLSSDLTLSDGDRARATVGRNNLLLRWGELDTIVRRSPTYVTAENLYSFARILEND